MFHRVDPQPNLLENKMNSTDLILKALMDWSSKEKAIKDKRDAQRNEEIKDCSDAALISMHKLITKWKWRYNHTTDGAIYMTRGDTLAIIKPDGSYAKA